MPEYSPNLNIEKALGTENVNRAYFMRVIDDIDEKVGVANGLAKLDANGNVLKADGSQAGEVTKTQFDTHTGQAATTLKVGHVQLSDAVTSTDVTKAATSNAVKKAYDRADAAFTSASNGKTAIKDAVTGADPRVVVPTDPTFTQLATAVGQIQTGKKFVQGTGSVGTDLPFVRNTGSSVNLLHLTVTGLPFKASYIIIRNLDGSGNGAVYDNRDSSTLRIKVLNSDTALYKITETGNAYVNATSFQLPVGTAYNQSYEWIAFE